MGIIFNDLVFQLYLGGLFSLIFAVTIVFIKQLQKRNIERKRLEQVAIDHPETVGDIEAKLNDDYDFRTPNFMEELVAWGVQPLFIICFINLFTVSGELEITIAFLFIVFTLFHEFYWSDRFSKHRLYQWTIIGLWVLTFVLICIRTNQKEAEKTQFKEIQKMKKDSTKKLKSFLLMNSSDFSVTNRFIKSV